MLDATADFLTVKLGQDTTWMGHRLATPGPAGKDSDNNTALGSG